MNESNNISVIWSQFTAIAAIAAPVITTLISNIFQYVQHSQELKQKRIEQFVLHKRNLFESFLSAFNSVCQLKDKDSLARYASSYSLVYIYLPKKVREDLGKVNLLIEKEGWDEAIKYVDAISIDISRQLDKLLSQL